MEKTVTRFKSAVTGEEYLINGGSGDAGLVVRESVSQADLEICDEYGNVLLRLYNGGIETQNLKSELYGKRIINYGDSIAFGENSYRVDGDATTKGYSYAPMLADAIGGSCNNRAVSGYTISQVLSRINDDLALTNYDIVFLEGGTNDMSTSLSVGTVDMTDNTEPSSSPSTYAQYVERIMWVAKSRFVGGFVYWVIPHRMATRTLSAQEAYWSVVKQAAAKWGVCVIDIYGNSCFTASPPLLGAEYTDFNDPLAVTHGGTHPNTEGYKKYYLPIVYDTIFRTARKVLN